MIKSTRGFYTVEAAIILPLIVLAILTLGYFLKADAAWESSLHATYDECSYSQAIACSKSSKITAGTRIKRRLNSNPNIDYDLNYLFRSYSNGKHTNLNSLFLRVRVHLSLPLGFGKEFKYGSRITYRDYVGLKYKRETLGSDGLETATDSTPVWIFPQSGTKYHKKSCTYVNAAVYSCILSNSLKQKFDACSMCHSSSMPIGSIVFCFRGKDTCYHRGNCRSIKRHSIEIDKNEAKEKGYTPCSKCGG